MAPLWRGAQSGLLCRLKFADSVTAATTSWHCTCSCSAAVLRQERSARAHLVAGGVRRLYRRAGRCLARARHRRHLGAEAQQAMVKGFYAQIDEFAPLIEAVTPPRWRKRSPPVSMVAAKKTHRRDWHPTCCEPPPPLPPRTSRPFARARFPAAAAFARWLAGTERKTIMPSKPKMPSFPATMSRRCPRRAMCSHCGRTRREREALAKAGLTALHALEADICVALWRPTASRGRTARARRTALRRDAGAGDAGN